MFGIVFLDSVCVREGGKGEGNGGIVGGVYVWSVVR